MDRSTLGARGEQIAARWLVARGYRIVARGWRLSAGELRGELDLVAVRGRTLVVVEVKTRRGDQHGGPLVAVTPRKQAKVRALAVAFVRDRGWRPARIRFDVVGVQVGPDGRCSVTHVPAAF